VKVSLNQHVERTIQQKLTKPVDQRQRDPGDLLFRLAFLFPFANVSANRADGCFPCLGGGRKEKIFAGLTRFGFEL